MAREIRVKTPLGRNELVITHLKGRDQVSRCFAFELGLASRNLDLSAESMLAQPVTVTVGRRGAERHIHGLVDEFGFIGTSGNLALYRALLRPSLWGLSRTSDNRIFQELSVVDIVEEVLSRYPEVKYEWRLEQTYEPRPYCVQFGESDLDFVSRLLEGEGIFYFFEHTRRDHRVIFCDANAELKPAKGAETVAFNPDRAVSFRDGDFITEWSRTSAVVTGGYAHTDYDFRAPAVDLAAQAAPAGGAEYAGEAYHYPGNYADPNRGRQLAAIRAAELHGARQRIVARSTARGLVSGSTFKLKRFPRRAENGEYLILGTDYAIWDDHFARTLGREGEGFEVALTLIPVSQEYRPERRTPRPVMSGPQTARVVGPPGEEIFTDEFGRVKVSFHWDRQSANDETSSCWLRVSQAWAGDGWGLVHVPRVGDEVLVAFERGDIDRPIVIGRLYNGAKTPPYGLPEHATQSGWKSNSSPGGGGHNELRFEDLAGSEEVYFHAERNHVEIVKNDESRAIGHDLVEEVGNDARQSVGRDASTTVGSNRSLSVGANETVSVGAAQTISVAGNRTVTVQGEQTVSVGGDGTYGFAGGVSLSVSKDQTTEAGGNLVLKSSRATLVEAKDSITLKCGGATIVLKKDGTITIDGKDINLNASGKINIKAASDIVMKGSKIIQN